MSCRARHSLPQDVGRQHLPSWCDPGISSLLGVTSSTQGAAPRVKEGYQLARGYAEVEHGAADWKLWSPSMHTGSLLSFFLSMSHEVKSLPGIPPSPAPAIATFSQAPSQPQASQTLTPLALQTAPQVRATSENQTEGSGQEQAWGGHGVGNRMRQGRMEVVA